MLKQTSSISKGLRNRKDYAVDQSETGLIATISDVDDDIHAAGEPLSL